MIFVIATAISGFISVQFLKKNSNTYKEYYNEISLENKLIKKELDEFKSFGVVVDVTMYNPEYPQTDSTPDITADGTKIIISRASNYRYVALSRNLLKRWGGAFDYGDFILIKGTENKDGVYQVKDTMNSRWVNVVDILESSGVKPYKFQNANIFKLTWMKEQV
jgi:predicted SpoU family rRNA methylase